MTACFGVTITHHSYDFEWKTKGGTTPIVHPVVSPETVPHPLAEDPLSCLNSTFNPNF